MRVKVYTNVVGQILLFTPESNVSPTSMMYLGDAVFPLYEEGSEVAIPEPHEDNENAVG